MTALVKGSLPGARQAGRSLIPLVVCWFAAVAAFLLAPGDIAGKSHAFLHGVCAQRPSHSLLLGGTVLPLDARMSGIYIGAASTVVWLLAMRLLRATQVPPLPVIVTLGAGVLALAIDGFNGLASDLQFPSLYEPSNLPRVATGLLGGVALGVAVSHLFASSLWRGGDRSASVVSRPIELVAPLAIGCAVAMPALSGLAVFSAPYAVGLVLAVLFVFWLLVVSVLALVLGHGWRPTTFRDMAPMAAVALGIALGAIGGLAALRFLAEQALALPRLT